MADNDNHQSKGGHARRDALTREQRKEIARKAASARWDQDVPRASHEGEFNIGDTVIAAAVLENGKRLLTQATLLRAIGRSRSPKGGTGVLNTVDGTPFFLQAEALKPFITEDLLMSTTPIFFRDHSGKKSVGYEAGLLPAVAEVYLRMRDALVAERKPIPTQYDHIIRACDAVMRGLARVGIVALVDEATGYQDVRDRKALQAILDQYLRKELAAWAKRFPDEFYKEMFRLKGWPMNPMRVKRPGIVGTYTNNIVYERLAPGILEELEKRNPKDEKGNRRGRHHQLLTDEVGHPALAQHLYAVIGFMRASTDWGSFLRMLDRAFPKKNATLELELPDPTSST